MNRVIVYAGQQSSEQDILFSNLFAMKGIGHLAFGLFGGGPVATGFSISSSSTAQALTLGPGSMYSLQSVDSSAYSSLGTDTSHNVVKQGVSESSQTLSFPAPTTVGYSINYLIEAQFVESDVGSIVLPYYLSSNPPQNYPGYGGGGVAQPTERQAAVTITVKAGTAAPTGSQTTPAPDAGFSPLWQVTVPYGATTLSPSSASPAASSILSQYTLTGIGAMLAYLAQQAGLTPNPSDPTQLYGSIFQTGWVQLTLQSAAPPGWVLCNDGTIGNASSGGTALASTSTQALFSLLWNNVSNTYAPVSGGRGASAAADFAANKTIQLTQMMGRALAVSGSGSGLSARTLGETVGEEAHTLSVAEVPPLTVTIPLDAYSENTGLTQAFAPVNRLGTANINTNGGGGAHNTMQPTSFLNAIIKL